jgi:hypothetical protein
MQSITEKKCSQLQRRNVVNYREEMQSITEKKCSQLQRRNVVNYRGQLLEYEDWKMLKLKCELHINALKKEIEKKLSDS